MKVVKEKLRMITSIWNSLILEQDYLKDRLKFDAEKETNYFGEIMHYFNDTFHIIEDHQSKSLASAEFHDYILYIIGFIQILYIQQDLMDEMLVIFTLPKSSSVNKKLIRDLRNELVGHPISRDHKNGSKLKSSVFWLGGMSYSTIKYRRYNGGEWENAERVILEIDDLMVLVNGNCNT